MSFLPSNEMDKQRKQREYKEALDAQVQGKYAHNTAAAAGGAALPLINHRGQARPNQQPLLRQQYQFPSGNKFRFTTSFYLDIKKSIKMFRCRSPCSTACTPTGRSICPSNRSRLAISHEPGGQTVIRAD